MTVRKRLALITGGTRGIGKGIAQQLAASGEFHGFCLSYNSNRVAAEQFRDELLKTFPSLQQVQVVGGDLTLDATRDEIFETIDSQFSDYDLAVVVHNAGQYVGITSENAAGLEASEKVFGDGSLLREDDKVDLELMHYYQRLYGDAYVDLCERGLARMRQAVERRDANDDNQEPFRGSLVGISSPGCNLLQKPGPSYSMPGSGKSLMEYANRIFALQAGKLGVNVNVIIPGVTVTEAWDRFWERNNLEKDEMLDKSKKRIPMGETMTPQDIGDVVVFLAGKGGGRFMTGLSITVDGGLQLVR